MVPVEIETVRFSVMLTRANFRERLVDGRMYLDTQNLTRFTFTPPPDTDGDDGGATRPFGILMI